MPLPTPDPTFHIHGSLCGYNLGIHFMGSLVWIAMILKESCCLHSLATILYFETFPLLCFTIPPAGDVPLFGDSAFLLWSSIMMGHVMQRSWKWTSLQPPGASDDIIHNILSFGTLCKWASWTHFVQWMTLFPRFSNRVSTSGHLHTFKSLHPSSTHLLPPHFHTVPTSNHLSP